MTVTTIHSVGFCAHYSRQGDWAFRFALETAMAGDLQLNIFHFLHDPYGKEDEVAQAVSGADRERLIIEREKELRLYYDEMLGDYLKAGFRLCEDNGWTELHRCMCKREFQVLVMPIPDYDAQFAGRSLAAFAYAFVCPTVLVGPSAPDEVYLNSPAVLLADRLPVADIQWARLDAAGRMPVPAAGLHGATRA